MIEIDVGELLDITKRGEAEEYIIGMIGEAKYNDMMGRKPTEIIEWLKNNILIRQDQKEKLKEALLQKDGDYIDIAFFIPLILDKNEAKELINIENGFDEQIYEFLMMATGNPGEYITPEIIKEFGIDSYGVINLIESTENPGKYITPEIIKASKIFGDEFIELIKTVGNPGKYITPEKIKEFGIGSYGVIDLIKATGNPEKYITPEKIKEFGIDSYGVIDLIKSTENPGKYITPEIIKASKIIDYEFIGLIKTVGNPEKYITPEIINASRMSSHDVISLIESTENPGEYITPEIIKASKIFGYKFIELIKTVGNPEEYITPEIINASRMSSYNFIKLIKLTENPGKYITPEKIKELGIQQIIDGNCIVDIIGLSGETKLAYLIDSELKNGTYNHERILEISKIIKDLDEANSGKLSRIKNEIALQIYELSEEDRKNAIETIKNMFLTNYIPTFAQNFLVFQQLHPSFMENSGNTLYNDRSIGNIPSLYMMDRSQRSRTIFTDLLKINIESNNRNLKSYLNDIEKGNNLLDMVLEGKLQINDKLPENERQILRTYSEILNSIYNQVHNKHDLKHRRENSGDLQQDLIELSKFYKIDKLGIESLPDRIVRSFAQPLGLRSFSDAKTIIESIPRAISERNKNRVKDGQITLKKGDLAKGVANTEYIASMFQNGIVAKDYLGQNAGNDFTPCDMDCELITEEGIDFFSTYAKMKTAPYYANTDVYKRKLGKVVLIFENDRDFVKTREGRDVNKNAVETVIRDKSKIEYFDNSDTGGTNAYGIRTGIGSTRIKCIISDRYIDKLGLEIALNGFYIPVVDEKGKVIFTPEMYDQIRGKMQGLSHYGLTEFQLDESAKNEGTRQLIDFIEQSKEEVSHKREMIIQTLKNAIEEQGLTMSTQRKLDLLPGIVEVIDTGSTGRGTNEPGDGDFDFMMRIDKSIVNRPEEFKEKIRKVLSDIARPEGNDETIKGDFRYKGVSIDGLEKKVDLDLTFEKRTDEIEYTTEECIKDRLETIKRNNPEDYKYVVANILLAKRVLKTEGVYKKQSAAQPEPRS